MGQRTVGWLAPEEGFDFPPAKDHPRFASPEPGGVAGKPGLQAPKLASNNRYVVGEQIEADQTKYPTLDDRQEPSNDAKKEKKDAGCDPKGFFD